MNTIQLSDKTFNMTGLRKSEDEVASFGTVFPPPDSLVPTFRFKPEMLDLMEPAAVKLANSGAFDEVRRLGYLSLMLNPLDPRGDFWVGLGEDRAGNYEDAELAYRTTIKKNPGNAATYVALGVMLIQLGRYQEALEPLQLALALQPHHSHALQGLMLALFMTGDIERGWNIYVRRNRFKNVDACINKYPDTIRWWDGCSKSSVLFIGEEGPGERIMFSSVLPEAMANGAKPIIEMIGPAEKFAPLFVRSFPDAIVATGQTEHPVGSKLNIGDLGHFYRRSWGEFPQHSGYLKANRARTENFRRRLSPGPVIGISWKSEGPSGEHKSIPLQQFAPILKKFPFTFVDLQYGDTEKERNTFAPLMNHLPDVDLRDDIDGMASLVAACDLVITISNVTAHVAGGLGVPVWMLAPYSKGLMWFWFAERKDSPWYPSMEIWRQLPDGWDHIFKMMADSLDGREWPEWKTDNTAG